MAYEYSRARKPASAWTIAHNRRECEAIGLNPEAPENEELRLAEEGQLRSAAEAVIRDSDGRAVWDLNDFDFLDSPQPLPDVHPSLWLNGRANRVSGVFEVVPGIYQVRGLDLANLTLVRSETGWIIFDCGTNIETAQAAMELAEETLQEEIRPAVRAIIISHSHLDHYGGVRGVIPEERFLEVPVYVPADYDREVVKEHVFSGTAMVRRKKFQVGSRSGTGAAQDLVSTGIGLTQPTGHASFVPAAVSIEEDCTLCIDGLEVCFMLTPESEAPAEMINYLPKYHALWMAELCNSTLHNLYPIRGAQVRDALAWSGYITRAIDQWGAELSVVFQSHNWPHKNTEEQSDGALEYLKNTAAAYRYIHDETLQLANRGYTPEEIARTVHFPDGLARCGYLRPYYGTIPVNCRAVYQKYLGFYDGNPVHLNPLPQQEEAERYVRYMGGADRILALAEADMAAGDYAWVAEVTQKVIFADPANEKARLLCADAMEQMAYQSESGIWRNAYTTAAAELRYGYGADTRLKRGNHEILENVSADYLFDYMGIVLDRKKTADLRRDYWIRITNDKSNKKNSSKKNGDKKNGKPDSLLYHIEIRYGALLVYHPEENEIPEGVSPAETDHHTLLALVYRKPQAPDAVADPDSRRILAELSELLTELDGLPPYAVVEP